MSGFVKIYGSKLITSSLWDESPEARLVFLSMLAIADASGFIDIPNVKALARVLNLEQDYVDRALAVLMAPDAGSRTDDYEGRRVLRDGSGWRCVNYEKYREFRTAQQEANRLRVERHRANKAVTGNVSNEQSATGSVVTTEAEAEAEAEAELDTKVVEKTKVSSAEPGKADSTPEPIRFSFPVVGGREWGITERQHAEFALAFPAVDIDAQYRKARGWLMANPSRQKTPRGMPRFLFSWMERQQNRGGDRRVPVAAPVSGERDIRVGHARAEVRSDRPSGEVKL